MKKNTAFICIILLSVMNSMSSYAASSPNTTSLHNNYEETVDSSVVYENEVEDVIASVENLYDISANMPAEVVEELSKVAEISKEEQWLDETHLQISYNIVSKNPIIETTFTSGNTEEIYGITNYTYVMNLSDSTGTTSDTSVQSDVTLKNTAYYSYYDDGPVRMLKVTSGTSSVIRFLEKDLRNLVLNVLGQGFSNNGFSDESNSRTIASPQLNASYTLYSGFNNYYHTGGSKILFGSAVTYSHGNSSYTASAQINLGN